MRVSLKDLLKRIAGAEKAKDVFDRNARAGDDGLAEHHLTVTFDAGVLHPFLIPNFLNHITLRAQVEWSVPHSCPAIRGGAGSID
jgi:hypothetical protein